MPMTPKEMVKLLKANGFVEMRQTAHIKYLKTRKLVK